MKLKFYILLGALFFIPGFVKAAEQVDSFDIKIQINPDARVRVVESVSYDFGTTVHHGIYRDIPVLYQHNGGNYTLRITNVSVTDAQGNTEPFTTSSVGNDMELKIGNPNVTVTGPHVYVISYTAERAIIFGSGSDEFSWNVTGNGWGVPIASASASVDLGSEVPVAQLQSVCYQGIMGSTKSCEGVAYSTGVSGATRVVNFSQSGLGSREGLTIDVRFPASLVTAPSQLQNITFFIQDNWPVGIPVVVFFVLLYLWYTRGRDPKTSSVIVAEYDVPEGLAPVEMSALLAEQVRNNDISAEIIYLAQQGFIKITRLQEKALFFNTTDYQLDLLKPIANVKNSFDSMLLTALFGQNRSLKLSDLRNTFYSNIAPIKKSIFDSVLARGYFPENPNTVKITYTALGIIIIFAGTFLVSKLLTLVAIASIIVSGVLVIIFGFIMPRRTLKGAQIKNSVLGFKEFLSVTEKDRLKFSDAPDKNPAVFEKFLAYAMVLGVEKQWAGKFEGIYTTPPQWYKDPYSSGFNSYILLNSLHDFNHAAGKTLVSSPSTGNSGFGGGGFSGGGFGGGGGGSW